MNIKFGMTNCVSKKGDLITKKYKQETIIKGLGKTAIQRMVIEFYFSNFFSDTMSIKPLDINLKKGETTFNFYDGDPLSLLLSDSSFIPEEILRDIGKIILTISKNKLKTDKQLLKSYGATFNHFIDKSSDILDEYKINKDFLSRYNVDICDVFSEFFNKQPEVITHGDFWLSNILYNKKTKKLKLIDWEFADAGSIYIDLGTYYCYSLGFVNGSDLFLQNNKLRDYGIQLVRYFAVFRILRIISFVSLKDVRKTNIYDEYGLTYLINILKILLEDIDCFQLKTGRKIAENIDPRIKVSVLVKNKNDKILLLKRKSDDKFPDMWEFPGGRKEKGETLLEAIKRELYEETGLFLDNGFKYLDETNFLIKGDVKRVNAIFFSAKTNKQRINVTEHEKYGWFTIDEAIKLVDFEFLKLLLEKIKYEG